MSVSWPTGSRTHRALGKIKGRAEGPAQGKGPPGCSRGRIPDPGAAAGALGCRGAGPSPQAPGAQQTDVEVLLGLTSGPVPERVSGGAVAIREHQGAAGCPLTPSEPEAAAAPGPRELCSK